MSSNLSKYRKAFDISQALLDVIGADAFPIDFYEVFAKKKGAPILLSSLSDYNAWTYAKGPKKWAPLFIQDAKCLYFSDRNAYMIVYNEAHIETRTRFSFAHELGHIVLGHLNDERTEISRGGLDDPTYYAMEGAANTFAGNFLAPPILIMDWLNGHPFDDKRIAMRFNISPLSVKEYRAEDCKQWLKMTPSKHEKALLTRCSYKLHQKFCHACKGAFSVKGARYCQFCGSCDISSENIGGNYMAYPGATLNERGQATPCLNCHNEEHLEEARYCMVCGKPATNQCTFAMTDSEYIDRYVEQCQHKEPLPGSARFCPYCGSKTTFFEQELLLPWDSTPTPAPTTWAEIMDEDGEIPF